MKPPKFVDLSTLLDPVVIPDEHPPARSALLTDADERIMALLVSPYSSVAHICDATAERIIGVVVTPGWTHARAWLVQSAVDTSGTPSAISAATQSGGESGADLIAVPSPLAADGVNQLAVEFGLDQDLTSAYVLSSDVIDDTPSAAKNRAFTLTPGLAAYTERWRFTGVTGFTPILCRAVDDLQTLE